MVGPLPPEAGGHNPGGVGRHVWGLSNALMAKGHVVHVLPMGRYLLPKDCVKTGMLCFGAFPRPGDIPSALAIAVHVFRNRVPGRTAKAFLHIVNAAFRVATVSKSLSEYDIIHTHGINNCALTALRAASRQARIIVTIHGYSDIILRKGDKRRWTKRIGKRLESANGVIHVSHTDRLLAKRLGVNLLAHEFVVYNGVLEPEYSYTFWTDRKGFCFVGNLKASKRVDLVLNARRRCGSFGPPLMVAGSGPQGKLVRKAIRAGEPVHWVGSVANDHAREMMRKFCLLALLAKFSRWVDLRGELTFLFGSLWQSIFFLILC